ncbi:hypothetical protein [Subtercola endophyticus]|uniref:hypothetical protein n=1 Tax=Subtercola endophyticus TaxID=2895559 RepID=UPI001E3A5CE5|nr:hypothetical protein [Subtercola endophyticus]UFS59496.1 hypothetical protein LQ955_01460 [Subtercola endophyticus]
MTQIYPLEDFTPEQKKTLERFARETGVTELSMVWRLVHEAELLADRIRRVLDSDYIERSLKIGWSITAPEVLILVRILEGASIPTPTPTEETTP